MSLDSYCPKKNIETIFMNKKNSKVNKPHKFVLRLRQRLGLRSSNKHVAFQNLSFVTREKNIKNNKLKKLART